MPVTLTNAGIQFSDGTFTNTNPIPSGTQMFFLMAAAPTGWTKIVTDIANDRILRINTTSGSGIGGSNTTTTVNIVAYHTHNITASDTSGSHTHTLTVNSHTHNYWKIPDGVTNKVGGLGANLGQGVTAIADTFGSGNDISYGTTYGPTAYRGTDTTTDITRGTDITTTGNQLSNHTHTALTGNGPSDPWQPKYINSILCSKN